MEGSTVSNYQQFATSTFNKHSEGLAALSIATGIISAVSKPFIAKLGDITSRPTMFSVILTIWTLGFIIAASSSTLSAYIVGSVFIAIGSSGIDLISDIICGDLVPLQWRGFCSSLLAFPYFITTWFTGLIVDALAVDEKWRWGYGMWAIIFPVALTPAIIMLFFLERKAQQSGVVNIASSKQARRAAEQLAEDKGEEYERGRGVNDAAERRAIWPQMKAAWSEIDAFGLILMGFGWSLLLLPFSLKSGADNGWKNPSLIASKPFLFARRSRLTTSDGDRRSTAHRSYLLRTILRQIPHDAQKNLAKQDVPHGCLDRLCLHAGWLHAVVVFRKLCLDRH